MIDYIEALRGGRPRRDPRCKVCGSPESRGYCIQLVNEDGTRSIGQADVPHPGCPRYAILPGGEIVRLPDPVPAVPAFPRPARSLPTFSTIEAGR